MSVAWISDGRLPAQERQGLIRRSLRWGLGDQTSSDCARRFEEGSPGSFRILAVRVRWIHENLDPFGFPPSRLRLSVVGKR